MSQFAAQPAASVIPEELLYGLDGAIATVTLNAPQRMNTISGPMLRQLTDALVRANEDKDVRVVILTGTGRAFCGSSPMRSFGQTKIERDGGDGAVDTVEQLLRYYRSCGLGRQLAHVSSIHRCRYGEAGE
ncbi:MAG TPA: enoyl-CoA hydratase-related protein, partial [Reyranella sp.]|nr:enoyl-CoA hydratase-related protein [Reyranella sp.]